MKCQYPNGTLPVQIQQQKQHNAEMVPARNAGGIGRSIGRTESSGPTEVLAASGPNLPPPPTLLTQAGGWARHNPLSAESVPSAIDSGPNLVERSPKSATIQPTTRSKLWIDSFGSDRSRGRPKL